MADQQINLQHLQDYLQLKTVIENQKPTEVRVSQQVFNWFKEQRSDVAKNFNMGDIPKKDSDISFMGVKLIPILELKK